MAKKFENIPTVPLPSAFFPPGFFESSSSTTENTNFMANIRKGPPEYSVEVNKNLNDFRKDGLFTDISIKIGDKHFNAHRCQLAAVSPVLKALVTDKWSPDGACELSTEVVHPEICESLLDYIYTGNVELNNENVVSFCVAAHFLQIQCLLYKCEQFLDKNLQLEEVLNLFKFAYGYQLPTLLMGCIVMILRNYRKVLNKEEILDFNPEDALNLVQSLNLKIDKVNQYTKKSLYRFVIKWVEHEPTTRLEHLPNLLKALPLDGFDVSFIEDRISTNELVRQSAPSFKVANDSLIKAQWNSMIAEAIANLMRELEGDEDVRALKRKGKKSFRNPNWREVREDDEKE